MGILDWFKRYNLERLETFHRSNSALFSVEDTRKRVSICVIDDEVFYPLPILRDHGFDIVQVGDISSVSNIDKYDIIACDLRGVGNKFSEKLQGAAIIQELKRARPEKYLIAYSGSFDRSHMARIADDCSNRKIAKSADIDKWVTVLDEAIRETTNPVTKWTKIRTALLERNVSSATLLKLESAYCRSVIKGDKSGFAKAVKKMEFLDDVRPIIQGLVASAIWAAIA